MKWKWPWQRAYAPCYMSVQEFSEANPYGGKDSADEAWFTHQCALAERLTGVLLKIDFLKSTDTYGRRSFDDSRIEARAIVNAVNHFIDVGNQLSQWKGMPAGDTLVHKIAPLLYVGLRSEAVLVLCAYLRISLPHEFIDAVYMSYVSGRALGVHSEDYGNHIRYSSRWC